MIIPSAQGGLVIVQDKLYTAYFKVNHDVMLNHGRCRVYKDLSDSPRDFWTYSITVLRLLRTEIMAPNPPSVDDLLSRNRYVVFHEILLRQLD